MSRSLAGLRFLEDVGDNESGLSHNLDGDLQGKVVLRAFYYVRVVLILLELRKIHGVLLNQEIRHS